MNSQGPTRVIIETGKEYREGQRLRERRLRKLLMNALILFVPACGYIYYLFYQAVHP